MIMAAFEDALAAIPCKRITEFKSWREHGVTSDADHAFMDTIDADEEIEHGRRSFLSKVYRQREVMEHRAHLARVREDREEREARKSRRRQHSLKLAPPCEAHCEPWPLLLRQRRQALKLAKPAFEVVEQDAVAATEALSTPPVARGTKRPFAEASVDWRDVSHVTDVDGPLTPAVTLTPGGSPEPPAEPTAKRKRRAYIRLGTSAAQPSTPRPCAKAARHTFAFPSTPRPKRPRAGVCALSTPPKTAPTAFPPPASVMSPPRCKRARGRAAASDSEVTNLKKVAKVAKVSRELEPFPEPEGSKAKKRRDTTKDAAAEVDDMFDSFDNFVHASLPVDKEGAFVDSALEVTAEAINAWPAVPVDLHGEFAEALL